MVPDPNSPPRSAGMRARIDLSSAVPMPQSAFAATARDVRSIFEAHGDANDSDTSSPIELWEDSKKLGPAHSSISEIVSLGLGRFRLEKGAGTAAGSHGHRATTRIRFTNEYLLGRQAEKLHRPRLGVFHDRYPPHPFGRPSSS